MVIRKRRRGIFFSLGALLFSTACAQSFVMRTQNFNRPVMVGNIRQINGAKITPPAEAGTVINAEIQNLETSTTSSLETDLENDTTLDSRLAAATVLGARDAHISELKVGSYVFSSVVFYLDKDWLRVSGYTLPILKKPPERVYFLQDVRKAKKKGRFEKHEKRAPRKSTRRRRR
ncbi:MAG: hypothetical protein JSR44_06605 [Spirochaetes bacterium]|nr:hypothetical protein [Spirochaetota bacterium]